MLVISWLCGNNAVYAQLTVGPTGMFIKGATTISVDSLVLQPSADVTLANLSITHTATPVGGIGGNSIRRVYTFSQPFSFTGTVGLHYAESELNGNTEPVLAFAYKRASDGVWITTTGSAVDTDGNYITETLAAPPILMITATSSSVTLPIVLRFYNAREEAGKVRLEWQTSLEQDVDRFEVERSEDGRNFSHLTSVKAANVATGWQYTAYDNHPATGYNYYRLLQYDLSGDKKDLGIRTVWSGAGNNMEVTAYPNPATQAISLRLRPSGEEPLHVMLFTAQGALVYSEDIQLQPGQSNYPLQIRTMPPKGEYFLRITSGKGFNRVLKVSIQ
ncbi:T9SS type A sorting domain-containing protein [Niastella populi]|nr:T9SS type A sorting domain-containing protein [Niastella populi]